MLVEYTEEQVRGLKSGSEAEQEDRRPKQGDTIHGLTVIEVEGQEEKLLLYRSYERDGAGWPHPEDLEGWKQLAKNGESPEADASWCVVRARRQRLWREHDVFCVAEVLPRPSRGVFRDL